MSLVLDHRERETPKVVQGSLRMVALYMDDFGRV
jgi:hypothetical protein